MLLNCGVGEDSWESLGLQGDPASLSERKSVLNIHWKDWCWSWNSNALTTRCKGLIWKDLDAGKDWGQEEKGTTEVEMAGWYHWLNGHGFGWTLGAGDGQGGLACCSSWGRKESDTTQRLNWTEGKHGCAFPYWNAVFAKFRLKLKKVGKTTRPFRYDLNQIPYRLYSGSEK